MRLVSLHDKASSESTEPRAEREAAVVVLVLCQLHAHCLSKLEASTVCCHTRLMAVCPMLRAQSLSLWAGVCHSYAGVWLLAASLSAKPHSGLPM